MSASIVLSSPMVSVLMSCFNGERWVGEAIQSVLQQTFADFELILVDDGSTDGTLSVLRHYSARDKRIAIIEKDNTGLADSLNVGIGEARGEWIARLDADDVCEPTRLAKQMELLRSDSTLVLVGTALSIIDERGERLQTHRYPTTHDGLLRNLQQMRKFPPHSSAMYRASAVRSIGGYRSRIRRAEDWDLWLRLSAIGRIACVDEPLVRIRKHTDQISRDGAGRRQILDSRLSLTSYWLRARRFQDPVAEDADTFECFKSWVDDRLEASDLYRIESLRVAIASALRSEHGGLFSALVLLRLLIMNPFFSGMLVWRRIFGESVARRLARDWSRNHRI